MQAKPWESVANAIAGASDWIAPGVRHIILHAGSNNSATNWSIANYEAFMQRALQEGCRVVWTGTEADAKTWSNRDTWSQHPDVIDTIGKLTLDQLMSMIQVCDGLVASSTGPLHLASGLGRPCVGLYGNAAPIWPERWHPIGPKATWLATHELDAAGSLDIDVEAVWQALVGVWEGDSSATK
jgi:ADP-heptose:LPS heptosyltransferase